MDQALLDGGYRCYTGEKILCGDDRYVVISI